MSLQEPMCVALGVTLGIVGLPEHYLWFGKAQTPGCKSDVRKRPARACALPSSSATVQPQEETAAAVGRYHPDVW
eukprot:8301956-Karenia_brevis.AAC.1